MRVLSVPDLSGRPSSLCGVMDSSRNQEPSDQRSHGCCAGWPEEAPAKGGFPWGDALLGAMLEGYGGGGGAGRVGGRGTSQLEALGSDWGVAFVPLLALRPHWGDFALPLALGPYRGGEFVLMSRSRVVKAA